MQQHREESVPRKNNRERDSELSDSTRQVAAVGREEYDQPIDRAIVGLRSEV